MDFPALAAVVRGYALAGAFGAVLAIGGVSEWTIVLAIWFGGALCTLAIAAAWIAEQARVCRVEITEIGEPAGRATH